VGFLGSLHRSGRYAFGGAAPDDDTPGLWSDSLTGLPQSWIQGFMDTGIPMTPELAMTSSAVYSGITFMGRNMAATPLLSYTRIPSDTPTGRSSRRRAPELPIYNVLRNRPNLDHTALEYWEMVIGHVLLRGNAYSEIKPGSRSFADQIIPFHPDRVFPERLPSAIAGSPGRIIYRITDPVLQDRFLTQEEMFHIRGFMSDGLMGLSLTAVAARSIGGVIAADTYAARFFKSGASASLVAQVQDELEDEGEKELHQSIKRYLSGLGNVGGVLIVDQGTTVNKLGINPQEAQMLATREHGVREVARWLGIPTQVLADAGKEPTHASAEIFSSDLVKFAFRPFGARIEQAVLRDLIVDEDVFAEYLFDDLLRGDLKARSSFLQLAIFTGWMNRAEAREIENMVPGPESLEEFLQPTNMMMAGTEPGGSSSNGGNPGGNGNPNPTQGQLTTGERAEQLRSTHGVRETLFALELASRVVNRELTQVKKAARKFSKDGVAWSGWLREFYGGHAEYVSETLKVPISQAREYAARQGLVLEDKGIAAAEDWKQTLGPQLAELALGQTGDRNVVTTN